MGLLRREEKAIGQIIAVQTSQIDPNPAQPRKVFREEEIQSLAESIRQNGLLQPLTVRREGKRYTLVSGERRLRALRAAGIAEAPCILLETGERQSAVLALMENIQRADLNYFEEAAALRKLIVEWGISQQELGVRLGMAQPTIANKLRLLRFNEEEQERMLESGITERQARALLRLEAPGQREEAVREIAAQGMNTARTEEYIERLLAAAEAPEKPHRKFHPIVKDVRLFFNTINKALSLMQESGIEATADKRELEDCIEYVVRIPLESAGGRRKAAE